MAKRVATIEPEATGRCCPSVLASPLDATQAGELAGGFSALADPVRLRVLSILAAAPEGEVCVCDFVEPLGKSQPTVSHHLKILMDAGLLVQRTEGKHHYTSVDRQLLTALVTALPERLVPPLKKKRA